MSEATCDEVRELAPELALGIAAGEQRARALVHIASCTDCRTLVEELSRAADSLLLLAPPKEPPIGFEAHAVDRVRGMRPGRRLKIALAAAALVLVSIGGTAAVMNSTSSRDRDLAERYLELLEGQGELVSASLRTADGGPAGQVFVYSGPTNWVFIVVDAASGSGMHDVVFIPRGAAAVTVGRIRLVDGRGTWGSTTGLNVRALGVQLVSNDGEPAFRAALSEAAR
ncbi:MAG TPA: zf-HC2 domain-containing protein [Actinomycetota bacterium]|nr:zf-HC2 domain-containing protein [Actinomycetota bacterium]